MALYNLYQRGGTGSRNRGPVLPPCAYIPSNMPCMRQGGMHIRQPFSYMRLLNAVPGSQPVDIYANNVPVALGLSYKGFTEYLQVAPGAYDIMVFVSGSTEQPLFEAAIEIPVRSINTAVLIGTTSDMSMKTYYETVIQIPQGQLYLRFANLVPDGPDMDLVLSGGIELFSDVSYGMATYYKQIPAGTYVFYVQRSNTDRSLLYVPNIQLQPGRFYTIYIVGLMDGSVPLQALVPLDGNSYIALDEQ